MLPTLSLQNFYQLPPESPDGDVDLIYESKVPYADHCINHARGCYHNCSYCFSRRIAKRFGHVKDDADWSGISALRQLAYAGEKTWVSMEPLPPPEVVVVDPLEVVLAVSFVNRVVLGRWNYDGYEKTWADWYKDQADNLAEALEGLGKRYEVKDILGEKLTVVIP